MRGAVSWFGLLVLGLLLAFLLLASNGSSLRDRCDRADLAATRNALQRGELQRAQHRLRRAQWWAPPSFARALLQAELELHMGQFAAAESSLEGLRDAGLALPMQARLWTVAAWVALHRYRDQAARQYADQALVTARASSDPELCVRALLVIAKLATLESQPREAIRALEEAQRVAASNDLEGLSAEVRAEIGYLRWWHLSEIADPTPDFYQPALATFRRLGDRSGEALALDHIANTSLRADDLIAFFAQQDQALRLWEAIGNPARQAVAHKQIGWAWDRLENPRRATLHLERALQLAQDAGDLLLVPRLERLLASAEITSRRPALAAARIRRVLSSSQPWHLEGRSLYGVLGDAHRRLGEHDDAEHAYLQALSLDRLSNPSFRIWIGSGLARSTLRRGQIGRAKVLLAELEPLVGLRSDWSDRRRILSLQASVLEAEKEFPAALAVLLEAAEIETRSLSSLGRLTVDHGLGILRRLLPDLLGDPATRETSTLVSAAPGSATQGSATQGSADSAMDTVWAAEAFRLLEQARLRPLRQQQLARSTNNAPIDAASETETSGERQALQRAREAARLAAATPTPQQLAELRQAYASYEAESFRARLRDRSALPASALGVAELQGRMRPDTVVISYVLLRRLAVALVLRHDRFAAIHLPFEAAQLRPRIKVLRHQLAKRNGEGWRAPAGELWQLLLAEVEATGAFEGCRRLYIVPMGDLHELPFAALLDAAGRPLIERMSVAHLPAATSLASQPKTLVGQGLVAVRESFGKRSLADLPAAREEAASVAESTGARLLLGRDLSESRFRQMAAVAPFLHLTTHARNEPHMPMLSRLVLASPEQQDDPSADGELTVRELLDLQLRAELVVLSACRSGLAIPISQQRTAELRRSGLVEGFLLAGARNVLATLFPVEDRATAQFMSEFARQLHRQAPIEALATVQRQAAAGNGPSAHPGHWSAFVLTGPGDQKPLPSPPATVPDAVSVVDQQVSSVH